MTHGTVTGAETVQCTKVIISFAIVVYTCAISIRIQIFLPRAERASNTLQQAPLGVPAGFTYYQRVEGGAPRPSGLSDYASPAQRGPRREDGLAPVLGILLCRGARFSRSPI